jgi:hypothetical protein
MSVVPLWVVTIQVTTHLAIYPREYGGDVREDRG